MRGCIVLGMGLSRIDRVSLSMLKLIVYSSTHIDFKLPELLKAPTYAVRGKMAQNRGRRAYSGVQSIPRRQA